MNKIAPAEGGNPNPIEREAQFELSKQLFDMEIKEINPSYVILLTNWKNWAEYFLDKANYSMKATLSLEYVQAVGNPRNNNNVKIIVVKRERFERSKEKWFGCVNEILDIIYNH